MPLKGTRIPRLCRKCGESRETEFYPLSRSECKKCACARTSARTKGKTNLHRERHLKRAYGITPEQYDSMFAAQRGLCALCGKPPNDENFMVDHDHKTNEIRGLVHRFCNSLLGFACEDESILFAAVDYLRRHRNPAR